MSSDDENSDDDRPVVSKGGRTGLSFSERRHIVMEKAETNLLNAKIDSHVSSCESFRKMMLPVILAVIGIPLSMMAFMLSELYQLKGWKNALEVTIESNIQNAAAEKAANNSRFENIVRANSTREETINLQLRELRIMIEQSRNEFHEWQLRESIGDTKDYQSGPFRRR